MGTASHSWLICAGTFSQGVIYLCVYACAHVFAGVYTCAHGRGPEEGTGSSPSPPLTASLRQGLPLNLELTFSQPTRKSACPLTIPPLPSSGLFLPRMCSLSRMCWVQTLVLMTVVITLNHGAIFPAAFPLCSRDLSGSDVLQNTL